MGDECNYVHTEWCCRYDYEEIWMIVKVEVIRMNVFMIIMNGG
jgi:hypothetical protein